MSSDYSALEDVADVIDSLHKTPIYSHDGLPMVRCTDVKYGELDLTSTFQVNKDVFDEFSRRYKPAINDIIITRVGTYGITARVKKSQFCLGQNTSAIVPRSINPRYLYAALNSNLIWSQIEAGVVGSTQKTLSLKVIKALKIPRLGSHAETEVAITIGALDDRISLLRETNATLEAIAQTLFKSWFVDFDPVHAKQQGREPEGMDIDTAALFPDNFEESELGLVPKGWRVKRLADITERITKGTTPTTLKRPFVESGINFVKVESLTKDGEFIPEKFAYIDSATHELLKRSQLQVDDVLITIAGTIGRIAVMTEDFLPANTNQAVALIRPDANLFPGGLIKHFLQRDDSRQTMGDRVVQAVQANLSLGSLSDLMVVVPPVEAVKQLYGAGIEQIDLYKRRNQQQIRTLTSIRDTLLPRLISGQLRLPETESLVEKISA